MKNLLLVLFGFHMVFILSATETVMAESPLFPLYPKEGSRFVSTKSTLLFRPKNFFSYEEFRTLNVIVEGTKSGKIEGNLIFKRSNNVIIFQPRKVFLPGEKITVKVSGQDDNKVPYSFRYNFTVSPLRKPLHINCSDELSGEFNTKKRGLSFSDVKNGNAVFPPDTNLPDDFPKYIVTVNEHPGQGNYFINSATRDSAKPEYNLIIDTTGFALYFNRFPVDHRENFFTYHPTVNQITYFDQQEEKFRAYDNSFNFLGYYEALNGYTTDVHELLIEQDGTYWVIALDPEPVDMSQIYPGGCSTAVVLGIIVQGIDDNHDVIFEWSSWDHFSILDADTNIVDLTSCLIDYSHANALTLDDSGNIVLSSRNMSEITKIDRQTGDIIWRWGGNNNQFTFTNDTIPFKAQHHIRYLGNHDYSMFDNGNSRVPPYSRGLTYHLDETNMTATLINDIQKTSPPDFTPFMGSNTLLDDGGHLIGWAANYEKYVLTQYDAEGNEIFDIQSVDTFGLVSYRAGKFIWETDLFDLEPDTLNFGSVHQLDTLFLPFRVNNNSAEPLIINGTYSSDSAFFIHSVLPDTIPAGGYDSLEIAFAPYNVSQVSAAFSVYYQTDTSRISSQLRVMGFGLVQSVPEQSLLQKKVMIFPNPSNGKCRVSFADKSPVQTVEIYTLAGKFLKRINAFGNKEVEIVEKSGIYLIKLASDGYTGTSKLVVR